jgi:hypothetical protein
VLRSARGFGGLFGSVGSSSVPKLSSMKAYNSSAGPCFAGEGLVKVPGAGAKVRIEQLTRGMEIETMVGPAVPEVMPCNAVYSILLQPDAETPNAHTICVADVWCVTLGHGITSTSSERGCSRTCVLG